MAGLPSLADFDRVIEQYKSTLSARKLKAATMSRDDLDLIISILLDPTNTRNGTAGLRFNVKRDYKLDLLDSTVVYDVRKKGERQGTYARLVTDDEVYGLLCDVHGKGHDGRDKTYEVVKKRFANIKKDVVAGFIKECPSCQNTRQVVKPPRGKKNPQPATSPPPSPTASFYSFSSPSPSPTRAPFIRDSSPGPLRDFIKRESSPTLETDDVLPTPPAHLLLREASAPVDADAKHPSSPISSDSSSDWSDVFSAGNTGRTASRRSSSFDIPEPSTTMPARIGKEQPHFSQSSLEVLGATTSSSSSRPPASISAFSFPTSSTRARLSSSISPDTSAVLDSSPDCADGAPYSTFSAQPVDNGLDLDYPMPDEPTFQFDGDDELSTFEFSSSYPLPDFDVDVGLDTTPPMHPLSSSVSSSSSSFSSPPLTPNIPTSFSDDGDRDGLTAATAAFSDDSFFSYDHHHHYHGRQRSLSLSPELLFPSHPQYASSSSSSSYSKPPAQPQNPFKPTSALGLGISDNLTLSLPSSSPPLFPATLSGKKRRREEEEEAEEGRGGWKRRITI